jgi:Methane oxygenase PmoA
MTSRMGLALAIVAVVAGGLALLPAAEPDGVSIKAGDDTIEFLAGKALFTRYQKGPAVAKPYFWPLNGSGDVPLTRAWPMEKGLAGESTDHPHQKSAWFCHGDVIPEGIDLKPSEKGASTTGIDFWAEEKGHGIIACVQAGEPKVDGTHGSVTTRNEWRTAEGTKVLDETRTIHVYNFGDTRLLVCDADLYASVCPITFGDTKEGAFGIRISDSITEEKTVDKKKEKGPGRIENAEGKVGEKECWGYPSAWCDYSGPIGGKTVGLAILTDPQNLPSCWHSRGYGLMAANPFGREKSGFPAMKGRTDLVRMTKGEHLKFRFGILLHPGDAKEGKVAEWYEKFVKLRG